MFAREINLRTQFISPVDRGHCVGITGTCRLLLVAGSTSGDAAGEGVELGVEPLRVLQEGGMPHFGVKGKGASQGSSGG